MKLLCTRARHQICCRADTNCAVQGKLTPIAPARVRDWIVDGPPPLMPLQTKPQKGRPKGKQDRQCSQREAAIALKRTRARINAMQQITRKAAKAAALPWQARRRQPAPRVSRRLPPIINYCEGRVSPHEASLRRLTRAAPLHAKGEGGGLGALAQIWEFMPGRWHRSGK